MCGILQVASEGPLTDTFLYGRAVGGIDPTVLDPLELLDGALTNGAYDWPAVRNVTATYQDSSLVRTLLAGHGERLRFAGLILALGYLDGSFEKQRSAMLSARLARWLGADGAICTTFSSGNSHTDTMLTVRACESLGIRTTAIISETNGGLTDHVAEADSIVSVGNEDELVEPWTPDRVVGAAECGPIRRAGPDLGVPGRVRGDRRHVVDGGAGMTVVHYLNQFFAGLGGEEAAGHEPVRIEGATGPGRGLVAAGLEIDVTLACGDDRFGEHEEESLARLLAWLDEIRPDVLVCGPSFGSGRYGYACGSLAREAGRRGIPVVSGMTPDSPGVLAAEGAAYIVPTGPNVASMRTVLPVIASLATRLAAGEPVGSPEDEGYLPRGLRTNVRSDRTGAERAIDLLLAKIGGDVRTEVVPRGDRVAPPAGDPRHHHGQARARHRGGVRATGQSGPVADPSRERLAPVSAGGRRHRSRPVPTSRCMPGSTRPPRTPTRTGWCRSTPCASWKPRAGSAHCMTCSTRPPGSTRPSPRRRSSGARSRRSSGTRASRP